jgi:hypothetical protein
LLGPQQLQDLLQLVQEKDLRKGGRGRRRKGGRGRRRKGGRGRIF